MLIGGDDINNDVITFGTCSRSFLLRADGRNLTAQSMGSPRGIGGGIQIPETKLQALLPFPVPPPERPRELAHRLNSYHRLHLSVDSRQKKMF